MASPDTHIRFTEVDKAFGAQTILDRVSFDVPRASAFCLLGRSGMGKSVTLKLLAGLLTPDNGRVLVDEENIPELTPSELSRTRQKIGFLFQHAALFDSLTLGENIAFPLERHRKLPADEMRAIVERRLGQVGLSGHQNKMPAALSGGMKKRAGLARALALEPEVLLVDEPSAGLDPITSAEIEELLLELKSEAGTTMVVVTHNIPSARRIGDKLAVLHEGSILAEGSAVELEHNEHPLVREFMMSKTGG